MKTWSIIASALAVGLAISVNSAQAVEASYAELIERVSALEEQQCAADCGTCCGQECCCPVAYVGLEATFLRPYTNGLGGAIPAYQMGGEYQTGIRLYGGWQNGAGVGARLRWWTLNRDINMVVPAGAVVNLDMDAFDAEITLDEQLYNFDVTLSGGIRYGRAALGSLPAGVIAFEGTGPTVALEVRRQLGASRLSFVGNFRGSFLVGDVTDTAGVFLWVSPVREDTAIVWENQLGVIWTYGMANGMDLNIRGVWETQLWMNDTLADDWNGLGTNLALSGPTLTAELRW